MTNNRIFIIATKERLGVSYMCFKMNKSIEEYFNDLSRDN